MSDAQLVKRLSQAIQTATRAAKFCVGGELSPVDPDIRIDGFGQLPVPLKRSQVKGLISRCRVAPYGKGTETLVDTAVRNAYELDASEFQLGKAWDDTMAETTRHVALELGLPPEDLEARLYKLLVYEKGGFFLPHRDSEKHDRMLASLIVVLPNEFEGGMLVVRHGAAEHEFPFAEAAQGRTPCYAAFFADCEHEVQQVERGRRLCLTYNLVLKPSPPTSRKRSPADDPAIPLIESIQTWTTRRPGEPLVFALDHYYTEHGLSQDLLKGADRALAELLIPTAAKADCCLHMAQVTRHLQQFADDGSIDRWERRWSRHSPPAQRALQIGETYADDLEGTQWTSLDGRKEAWGEIKFDPTSIVSTLPLEDWTPTSQEFEGYTGNAGNTLDRWYHRSAIVLWRRDQHYNVLASLGPSESIPLLESMLTKLAKTPKKSRDSAHENCRRLAQAIIGRWPRDIGRFDLASTPSTPLKEFPKHLLVLQDRETISLFLAMLAKQDRALSIDAFLVASCQKFGWTTFAEELRQLLIAEPLMKWQHGLHFRDAEWLAKFCGTAVEDAGKSSLAQELCSLAAARFCEPRQRPQRHAWDVARREPTEAETSLLPLLQAILSSQSFQELSRVIDFVRSLPDDFDLGACQTPCLRSLILRLREQGRDVPAPLLNWLNSVRQQLEAATAIPPQALQDWTRSADVKCSCQYCEQLKAFLADPLLEVGRIRANEGTREHLMGEIRRHQCDVKHTVERRGSPYPLVLTKTTGSFDRAVKTYQANVKLLESLPS